MNRCHYAIVACVVPLLVLGAMVASAQEVTIREDESTAQLREPVVRCCDVSIYPPHAVKARIKGVVKLSFVASKEGTIQNVRFISGHLIFRKAVAEAMRNWKTSPQVVNGQPIAVPMNATIQFLFSDGKPYISFLQDPSPELLLRQVRPTYPVLARVARVQGPVVLDMFVNERGRVDSLNYVSGNPMLTPAAIEALKQWVFRPRIVGGVPTTVTKRIMVNFDLQGSQQIAFEESTINELLYPPASQIGTGSVQVPFLQQLPEKKHGSKQKNK